MDDKDNDKNRRISLIRKRISDRRNFASDMRHLASTLHNSKKSAKHIRRAEKADAVADALEWALSLLG